MKNQIIKLQTNVKTTAALNNRTVKPGPSIIVPVNFVDQTHHLLQLISQFDLETYFSPLMCNCARLYVFMCVCCVYFKQVGIFECACSECWTLLWDVMSA